ncbi:hypothetical protein [Caballeronia sordidicola]|uniref:hypothetical protein n=1 Tax=Caballeronia sordidicola TaxID=196367 RepID=UPI0014288DE6|nr:hypothetical protein [Caballeronia sordidicola]
MTGALVWCFSPFGKSTLDALERRPSFPDHIAPDEDYRNRGSRPKTGVMSGECIGDHAHVNFHAESGEISVTEIDARIMRE